MRDHGHRATRRTSLRMFVAGLKATERQRLFDDLARCDECARHYQALQQIEGVLCGTGEGPTPGQVARMLAALRERWAAPARRPARPVAVGLVAAGAAALGILGLLLWPAARPATDRMVVSAAGRLVEAEMLTRGGVLPENAQIGVRVFRVVVEDQAVTEPSRVTIDDLVTFTFSNTGSGLRHLTLFGLQEDGRVRWYYPGYLENEGPAIGSGVDRPLGDGFRLAIFHRPGWLRVIALFSVSPIPKGLVEEVAGALNALGPEAAQGLPFEVPGLPALEHSLLLQIDPRASPEEGSR